MVYAKRSSVFLVGCVLLLLAACGAPATPVPSSTDQAAEAPAASAPAAPATSQPTSTPAPGATTTTTPTVAIPPATLEAELSATVIAQLPPTPTPDPQQPAFGGFEGIEVLPLATGPESAPLWAVFSLGFRSVEQNHFIAVYTRSDAGWQELGHVELEFSDILFAEGVQQVEVTPERVWIEVQSGAGAHSGVYTLLSFDGSTLRSEVSGFSPHPGAGRLEDLNEDGTPEVVLDASDPYIFCYACNVIEHNYQVLRWNGSDMVEVVLTPLTDSAPADLQQMMNEAIELAQGGLWQDAEALAQQARTLNENEEAQNSTATWNIALLLLVAEARADHVRQGEYPLLSNLFYGDYTAIMGILSGYTPEELFSHPNPLVVGTVAEGFETALVNTVEDYTTRALEVYPNLAKAYFLRGWARYLANPQSSEALADVQRAADLEPEQALFADSVSYLGTQGVESTQDDQEQAVVDAARLYMLNRTGEQHDFLVTVEKIEGDYARVRIETAAGNRSPVLAFLKRENGIWGVLTDGEGDEPDGEIDIYRQPGIPETLIDDLSPTPETPSAHQDVINAVNAYGRAPDATAPLHVEVWAVEGNYARARIVPPDDEGQPSTVYLARQNGQWSVLLMDVIADEDSLLEAGIPDRLINLEADIKNATRAFIRDTGILFEPYYVEVVRVDSDYARVLVESADEHIDPATAFLKRHNGVWAVIEYNTSFSEAFFEQYGIPESLRN